MIIVVLMVMLVALVPRKVVLATLEAEEEVTIMADNMAEARNANTTKVDMLT